MHNGQSSLLRMNQNNVKNCEQFVVDDNMLIIKNLKDEGALTEVPINITQNVIHISFCLEKEAEFVFAGGHYRKKLAQGSSFIIYNPQNALFLNIVLPPGGRIVIFHIDIQRMHKLFLPEDENLHFLSRENIDKKFYNEKEIIPSVYSVLEQIYFLNSPENTKSLFIKAKGLELLSLYFGTTENKSYESCPFLYDENNVEKIRNARQILQYRMLNPPSLKELALEIGLNEYQLKVGFKNIYGSPVFQYLNDYKLEKAKTMLYTGKYKVNEAAYQIGYSNPSHFIAAFKKKFGFTPKKFLLSLK